MLKLIQVFNIWNWHKKTFKKATAESQLKKVKDEIDEATEEFIQYQRFRGRLRELKAKKYKEELIDVIIASINAMRFPEIRHEVAKKMKENKKRSWRNGQHKR